MPARGGVSDELATEVLEVLRESLAVEHLVYRRRPARLAGGKFSAVFAFDVDQPPPGWSGRFVLRMIESAPQAALESGLHAVAAANRLGPRVAATAPTSTSGDAYIVLERIAGRSYLRGVEPARFALDLPKLAVAWPRRLAEVITALGGVDPGAALEQLQEGGATNDLVAPGRHLRTVQRVLDDVDGLEPLVAWLSDHRPRTGPLALVHGDLWPANVFLRRGNVHLIDWTRGAIDDPAMDVGFAKVGFALMPEPFPPPPPIRQPIGWLGTSIAHRIGRRCDHLVGGAERVRYYEALRCALELADVVSARSAGGAPAGWDHGIRALVTHAGDVVNEPLSFE